jgi:hypothetical protein
MLWDIDFIFGMWVYNDKLQIKLTFRSGRMIFGRVMALGLWNLAKYLVLTSFFTMLGDIDLIFGIWVYNDELQIKSTFRSGPMMFGRVMTIGLWNLAKYLVVTTLFHYDLRYWLDFWKKVYNDKLQVNFEIHSGWMIFGQLTVVWLWNLAKYLVVTTVFSLWFEILTWFLVWECIVMSYRSSLNFVPIEWFWANLRTLNF